jgi:hypothetical protein
VALLSAALGEASGSVYEKQERAAQRDGTRKAAPGAAPVTQAKLATVPAERRF